MAFSSNPYQSPPGSGGNDGALPTVYDPAWQRYTNLTDAQKATFAAFPQFLIFYARERRFAAEISGITVAGGAIPLATTPPDLVLISQMAQAFREGVVTSVPFEDAAGNWHTVNQAQAIAVYQAVAGFIAQLRAANKALFDGINATPPTITAPKQIDVVYAAIAPNSPSAKNPSPI